jgi:hypothetical protein
MNYLLRDIPEEFWARVKNAASIRGLSARAFLLNAAFNEIERTGGNFVDTKQEQHEMSCQDKYLNKLHAVGIECLIRDFELFKSIPHKISNIEAVKFLVNNYKYTLHSARTKVSNGKSIAQDEPAKAFCLRYIVNSKKINEVIRNKAKKLLDLNVGL